MRTTEEEKSIHISARSHLQSGGERESAVYSRGRKGVGLCRHISWPGVLGTGAGTGSPILFLSGSQQSMNRHSPTCEGGGSTPGKALNLQKTNLTVASWLSGSRVLLVGEVNGLPDSGGRGKGGVSQAPSPHSWSFYTKMLSPECKDHIPH